MMAPRWIKLGAILFALLGIGAIARAATTRAISVPERRQPSAPIPRTTADPYPADSLLAVAVARDLFRVDRRPATVLYDVTRLNLANAPPAVPKPTLTLVGVVGGRVPTAVIEGFAGVEGVRVTRVGDVVSGLRVARIEKDRVIVIGMDTTWVLTVREPWK
jgi:hypothetical protein